MKRSRLLLGGSKPFFQVQEMEDLLYLHLENDEYKFWHLLEGHVECLVPGTTAVSFEDSWEIYEHQGPFPSYVCRHSMIYQQA